MKIYLLIQTMWYGSVPLSSTYSAYPNRQIAEAVLDKLMKVNTDHSKLDVTYRIEEIDYYSRLEEIPLMNI